MNSNSSESTSVDPNTRRLSLESVKVQVEVKFPSPEDKRALIEFINHNPDSERAFLSSVSDSIRDSVIESLIREGVIYHFTDNCKGESIWVPFGDMKW